MPRFSDDDVAGAYGAHVPGVWAAVLRAQRDYDAQQAWRYLGDPRLVLSVDSDAYRDAQERARADAGEWFSAAVAAGEPVTVRRPILRYAGVPKDVLMQDRSAQAFTVRPDDTITPALEDVAQTEGVQ
jgi:hypothetical protein